MKKRLVWGMIGCMALCAAGCGNRGLSVQTKRLTPGDAKSTEQKELPDDTVQKPESDKPLEDRYYGFSVELLKQTYKSGENQMISPMSLLAALTMTENGAAGETLSQMEQVLAGGTSVGTQSMELSSYMNGLPDTQGAHLNIANSIWVKNTEERLHINDNFLEKNHRDFQAEIFGAPFDESTLDDINYWIADETEQMIPKMLDRIDESAVMYLINAVAFDAEWEQVYSESCIRTEDFTDGDGNSMEAAMMYSDESLYLEDDCTTGFIKPYKDGYGFAALLPKEGMAMEDYIKQLSAEKLSALINGAADTYSVSAALPKFSAEYDIELSETLQNMGMTDAFDESRADFTGIGTYDGGNIYINMVLHKTYIEVEESGTKAGAATVVGVAESAAEQEQKTVHLDRPFVYAIIDSENNLPVFLGIIEKIE